MQKKHRAASWAMHITAVCAGFFLVAFFVVTVNNMATISSQVEEMKDGPFPTSVAAGHIETDIAQIETLSTHLTHFRLFPETTTELRRQFQEIDANLREQFKQMNPHALLNPADTRVLKADYEMLYVRLTHVLRLVEDESITSEFTEAYVEDNIMPLSDKMLSLANKIMDETTQEVSRTYTVVNAACMQTIILSCILMVCVVVLIGFYLILLRRKQHQENLLRQHLEEAVSLAEQANEAKSDFLSNMSHDIRTPMNAIIGLTRIADDNIDDPLRVKQCLTRIMTSSRHLLSLINDVLDMNKIESGKTTLTEERFSLPDLLSELITIVHPQSAEKHLHADVIINDIHHEQLLGDSMRLRQILLNLISNAIKYTNEGGFVRLIVTEDTPTVNGVANMQFVVEDNGIGMEEEFLQYVFEPFERERNDTTNFTEGTGLGMAITKNLVELMGGTIQVESEVGKGTKFRVKLPLKVEDDAEQGQPFDTSGFEGLRILIVDDNYLVMQNTIHTLTEFGVAAEGVTVPERAADTVAHALTEGKAFDLVIVDLEMPSMGGAECIQSIHEAVAATEEPAPTIVVASYGGGVQDDAEQIEGTQAVISQPLFRSVLYAAVRQCCIDDDQTLERTAPLERMRLGGRVLLVEDNEINREIGTELVSKFGPVVESAVDGIEAVAKVADEPDGYYDLVLMDCKMPHMNGFEATEALRKFAQERGRGHLPIVAMTANAFAEDRDHALASGMDGFLTKPIDMTELEKTLRAYLPKE